MRNDYYVYVYLDQTKEENNIYKGITMEYRPFYVGKGTMNRDICHLFPSNLKRKSFKNSIIKGIINKTGEQPIHYRIFENITEKEAIKIEIDFIKTFGRLDKKTGILSNCTDGGDGVNNLSKEAKKKIGKATCKKIYQYDLKGNFIKEWDKISDTCDIVGTVSNISTSIKRKGTCGGYIWSYEKKESVDKTTRYQMPIKYINVKQIDKNTGELIFIHDTALDAEKNLDLRKGARNKIYDCIKGKSKTAYGYKWEI